MASVTLRLHGTLNLYSPHRERTLRIDLQQPSMAAGQLLQEAGLPLDLLEMVALNGQSVPLDTQVEGGDLVEAFPLIGGG